MKLYAFGGYLLLISFLAQDALRFTDDMAEAVKTSPYNGFAVPYVWAYHHDYVDQATIAFRYKEFSKSTGKDIWPWVFLNRIIGYDHKHSKKPSSKKEPFSSIKGIDLDDKQGSLSEFYKIWSGAFRSAKTTGAPGVVFDLETYNDMKIYNPTYLAEKLDISKERLFVRLHGVGHTLADLAAKEYPDATIWMLFTGLSSQKRFNLIGSPEWRSITYIVKGMLDRSLHAGYRLKFISGGEIGIGYCNRDLNQLAEKIVSRSKSYAQRLDTYPNLRLGGTIAPWQQASERTGWMASGRCAKSRIQDSNDFLPIFRKLMESYDYIWVYAPGHSDYRPFEHYGGIDIHNVITRAAKETQ